MNINEFKPIPNFPKYIINQSGKIFSLKTHKNNKSGNPVEITPWVDKKGYEVVTLRDGERKRNMFVHRLVALTFIPNPLGLPCVNHKDRNVKNNDVSNLEWCTLDYNNKYTFTVGERQRGCACELYRAGVFVKRFQSISEAADYCVEEYDCNYNHICNFLADKQKEIEIKRKDLIKHEYKVYVGNNHVYTSRYLKDVVRFVKEEYGCSVTKQKMFNVTKKIAVIEDDSVTVEQFWENISQRHYNPVTYYWELFYNDESLGLFKGKDEAARYACSLSPSVVYNSLVNYHTSENARIEKRNRA